MTIFRRGEPGSPFAGMDHTPTPQEEAAKVARGYEGTKQKLIDVYGISPEQVKTTTYTELQQLSDQVETMRFNLQERGESRPDVIQEAIRAQVKQFFADKRAG